MLSNPIAKFRWSWAVAFPLVAGIGLFFGYWRGPMPAEVDYGIASAGTPDSPQADSFFRYTPPIALDRLANEWEPQKALILSLSLPEAMANFDIARYYINILELAHPYLDIYVFCEHEHGRAYAYFLSLINRHPKGDAILKRTRFVDSRNLMRWTRDFGPIFGVDRNKQLVAIDFVYRNLFKELEEEALQKDDAVRDFMTLQGDAMPADVVAMLQANYDIPVNIVRPALSMDGGDFVSDGLGNVFVSTQTLARNGGNREELEAQFRQYFGAKKLHVLESLPGSTVRHLDMILKCIDFETFLIPEYQDPLEKPLNAYQAELNRAVRDALEKNERYLRKRFPRYRFLKAPMPPILFQSEKEVFVEAKREFIKVLAHERGLRTKAEIESINSGDLVRLEKEVVGLIRDETPGADFATMEGFNTVLKQYGQVPLETVMELHADSVTRYRSYINSVFLNSTDNGQAFLLPRFTSSNPKEMERFKRWEAQVVAVYKSVWPQANIHWVNCDSMVSDLGFLHCTTITVPSLSN